LEALEAAPDFEVAGVVRRDARASGPAELARYIITDNIATLADVDVAVVCAPSRRVEVTAAAILERGICTVDSFDIHPEIADMRGRLDAIARRHSAVAVVSAGWDPGSDSVVRALMEACAPTGTTHTDFGPGMSMGHTVAARAVEGVREALSMTIPVGGGVHRREVYIELADGADFEEVAAAIKADPYFVRDEVSVTHVPDVAALVDMTHGVHIVREAGTPAANCATQNAGRTAGQKFEFSMRILNPALTAQFLVSSARAAVRLCARGSFGARTTIELAPIDYLPGNSDEIVRRLV
jgi:diaminopimelate dehydrogenase